MNMNMNNMNINYNNISYMYMNMSSMPKKKYGLAQKFFSIIHTIFLLAVAGGVFVWLTGMPLEISSMSWKNFVIILAVCQQQKLACQVIIHC